MSSSDVLYCSVCKKKQASKKLSILVDDEHYDIGKPEMVKLLYRLRELYEDEEQPIPPPTSSPPLPSSSQVVIIDPQPVETIPPPTAPPAVKTVDQYIHESVNKVRIAQGLKALSYDEALEAIALKHSKDMVVNDYFSHTGRDGSSVRDRMRRAGYPSCRATGENIAWFSTSRLSGMSNQDIGLRIFNQWWNSPGHKANMLSSNFSIEGIGIYISGTKVMATQDFCGR